MVKENIIKIVKLSKNYCRRIKVIYKNGKLSEKLWLWFLSNFLKIINELCIFIYFVSVFILFWIVKFLDFVIILLSIFVKW